MPDGGNASQPLVRLNVDRPMSLRLSYRSDLIVRSVMESVGAVFEEALDWFRGLRCAGFIVGG